MTNGELFESKKPKSKVRRGEDEEFQLKTKNGYDFFEVASAFQKAIRRGEEKEALFWGIELEVSNFHNYVWKRIRLIVSEDIGLASPYLPAVIQSLFQTWCDFLEKGKDRPVIFLIHAILLIARAKKSRLVDHATIASYCYHEADLYPIPDHALDIHTRRGQKLGRAYKHFWNEGALLNNKGKVEDSYENAAIKATYEGLLHKKK